MDILIYILIILAIGLIIWSLSLFRQARMVSRLPQSSAPVHSSKLQIILSRLLPTQGLLEKIGLSAKIKRKIGAAHLNMAPAGFFNLKILLMLALAGLTPVAFGKADPIYILAAVVFGYFLPDLYLKQRIAKRKYQIVRRLPETVDLLGLCIEAGLDFSSAVRWVIDKTPPSPINDEFGLVLEEIKWGKPRIQALKDMSSRLDIPEISSFVQTIVQAERMGTQVSEAFTILSEDVRMQRFHRGERIALQAPIKILLPLIFFIMPVIGIIIGGPIFLQFTQGKMIPGF